MKWQKKAEEGKWHFGGNEEEVNGELWGGGCDGISDSLTCISRTQLINPVYDVCEGDLWAIMRGVCVSVCECGWEQKSLK